MIYKKIFEFCKVRNAGNCFKNGLEPTNRVKFIMELLDSENIEYELDTFIINNNEKNNFFNIILKGNSDKMVIAHHDIVNPNIDNANDNSASIINAIALKKLNTNINVVFTDGEEMSGIGSKHLSKQINDGYFGNISWVLNLELSGKGGKNFFIGDYPGGLYNHILSLFNCPIFKTPYNDSVTLRYFGIDSVVINPLPILEDGEISDIKTSDGEYLDSSLLFNCHSQRDSLDTISTDDMKEFVEEVLIKIIA